MLHVNPGTKKVSFKCQESISECSVKKNIFQMELENVFCSDNHIKAALHNLTLGDPCCLSLLVHPYFLAGSDSQFAAKTGQISVNRGEITDSTPKVRCTDFCLCNQDKS